ncbi:hypothetical protein [Prevotella sp. KH2C16]|uniref:hypothetical protein n=1 Tax=Prevotella sp. KH2C16 TaxID=1855325 RepID=UPI0008E6960E|nr:hypothetical protein [Prevotella sp. KH2C16]SFG51642.1 hypothetical protein SAMN05216383_11825 [Prevotella sp. KH2C16]
MTDKELNQLMRETFERQKLLEDINQSIMQNLRKTSRRERARKWLHLPALCFGLPLFVMLMLYCAYKAVVQSGFSLPVTFAMLVFVISIIWTGYQMFENFSVRAM